MRQRIFFLRTTRLHPVWLLVMILLITSQACNFLTGERAGQLIGQVNQAGVDAMVPETGDLEANPQTVATEEEEELKVLPTRTPRRTVTLMPTVKAEPTFTSAPMEDDHEVSPDELHDLLGYGGWGAGYEGLCESGDPEIYLEDYYGGGSKYLNTGNPVYHGMYTSVFGCYFPPGEIVSITFYLPDGTSSQAEIQVDDDGWWKVPWLSLPNEPVGEYEAYVESASGYASLYFEVARPNRPIMTAACTPENTEDQLLLTGFVPGEEVLIGRYFLNEDTHQAELSDYQYFEIGEGGYLYITIPREKSLFIAMGSESPREAEYVIDSYDNIYYVSAFEFTELPPWSCD